MNQLVKDLQEQLAYLSVHEDVGTEIIMILLSTIRHVDPHTLRISIFKYKYTTAVLLLARVISNWWQMKQKKQDEKKIKQQRRDKTR